MRALWLMIRVSFAADRRGAVLLCLTVPLGWLAPTAAAVATKVLIDAAIAGSTGTAVLAGGLAAVSVALSLGCTQLTVYVVHALGKRADAYLEQRLGRLMTALPGIEHYERPDYLDQVQLLREQAGMMGAGLNASAQLVAAVCQVGVVCALLATRAPWLLLLVLFAVPSFAASARARRLAARSHERSAETDRLLQKVVRLASEVPAARETRLFGLRDELLGRRRGLAARVDRERNRALLAGEVLHCGGRLVFGAGYLGAVILVLRRAATGDLAAGDVAMIIVLAGQVEGFVGNLVGGAQFMLAVHQVAERMRWLESYGSRRPPHPQGSLESYGDIRIEHVSFGYFGLPPVLHDISLTLRAGSVVALVGDNGAGKSTLVKLLLALYRPTSGHIRVAGTDLQDVDPDCWRARCTATFQDYCAFEFRIRDAVGVGDLPRRGNPAALAHAIAASGAAVVVDTLPQGLRTQLGASWPGGVDLSGGQWQRVALARGRMRRRPQLLVLDEPTAALDAETEHELFERYAAAARDEPDSITLLVTHRFSTVRTADRIVVLDAGRIRETGTHEELLAADGLYAELYRLQARGYA